jgi:protein-tyrosine phosphatase
LPITGGKPPTPEQVKTFVYFANSLLEQNQPVAVHCTSGNRRTGTLLAAYLIASGEMPEKAVRQHPQSGIAQIQQVRPTAELQEAQKQFLLAGLKQKLSPNKP